jgi:peptide/nickel transport system ATP-binding protein
MPLLSIQDLSVKFKTDEGEFLALKNIDIEVNRGEIVAIVGESGSGKSVTSLSVLQLIPSPPAIYTSGKILFDHNNAVVDLLHADQQTIRSVRGNNIAMIFQEPMTSLNPVLTCGKQVQEALLLHKHLNTEDAKKRTLSLFQQVELPSPEEAYNKYPHQLSGGQKQRVMIAMAMSCEPDLLICDEPTTALDVTVQKNILQLIRDLQKQNNMGVIFITHDLGVVSEIADRIVVMYKGEIVETGTTKELLLQPKHPYTKALLACRPALHPKGERLPIVSDFLSNQGIEIAQTNEDKSSSHFIHSSAHSHIHTSTHPETLFTVKDLNVWYETKTNFFGKVTRYNKAVTNVNFEIFKGETLGLVGESGCGKTTVGRTLLGLIKPTAGEIIYKGNNIAHLSADHFRSLRKEMQLIFQDPYSSLDPPQTIGDAIEEPLKVHGIFSSKKERKEKVIELLKKVSLLPEHYNRYPHEFSGGQRQRIVIARALILEPEFIVCDESVSALDVSVQAQVLNLLNDLKKEFQFTALFISHDLSVVRYISDRIIVMNKGEIVEVGNAEEVYTRPKAEYTQKLLSSIPKLTV